MRIAFLLVAVLVLPGCGADSTEPGYVAEIAAWHAGRIERLRSDTGWLTLVGLHPLLAGAHTLGASPEADLRLAPGAPAWVGTLTVAAGRIDFVAHPNAVVTSFDDPTKGPLSSCTLATDREGPPTRLAVGSLVFYVIDRDHKLFLRVKDRQAETLKNFAGIARFPVDRRWRLEARLESGPATVQIPDVLGHQTAAESPGVLIFSLAGKECRLTPTGRPGDRMFLVFGDETNGKTTYAGGRFLVVDPPATDGRVVLDFNRAYNPPCVFTPYATCPLPTLDNILPVPVTAGEMLWGWPH
jgi:uncharacterized protein (DUF1684 family)